MAFTSGPEHLHQARAVTDGSRFVLATWFTLSRDHGVLITGNVDFLKQAAAATAGKA
eukprot:SAG31_NODE_9242_length_1309_cov_1.163636_1_plen_56_part_10